MINRFHRLGQPILKQIHSMSKLEIVKGAPELVTSKNDSSSTSPTDSKDDVVIVDEISATADSSSDVLLVKESFVQHDDTRRSYPRDEYFSCSSRWYYNGPPQAQGSNFFCQRTSFGYSNRFYAPSIRLQRSFTTSSITPPPSTPRQSSFSVQKGVPIVDFKPHSAPTRRLASSGSCLHRRWEPAGKVARVVENALAAEGSPCPRSGQLLFKVCSYNVLCQETMQTTEYLYSSNAPEWLEWDHRWSRLKRQFSEVSADLFCLQEVNAELFVSHFRPFFASLGFDSAFKKRTGLKPDGCAIFWLKSKFHVKSISAVEYQVEKTYLDRDNVGLIVLLEVSNSQRKFLIATTHLLFNPARGDIKLCQLAILLSRLKKLASAETDPLPSIVCGDFNSTPQSPLYKLMVHGSLFYQGLPRGEITGQGRKGGSRLSWPILPELSNVTENCECIEPNSVTKNEAQQTSSTMKGFLNHDLLFRSAYTHKNRRGQPEITTYHSKDACCVDYIFYSTGQKTPKRHSSLKRKEPEDVDREKSIDKQQDSLQCTRLYSLPDAMELRQTTGMLPSRTEGSDHVALAAEFIMSI